MTDHWHPRPYKGLRNLRPKTLEWSAKLRFSIGPAAALARCFDGGRARARVPKMFTPQVHLERTPWEHKIYFTTP